MPGLVSVVIPSYNRAGYLPQAIDSVLAQTYRNVEIIVVDDGSTDGTETALEPYRERIVYVRQENQGLPAARNTGIRHARGEFIAFLDSDDLFLPTKLACQVDLLRREGAPDVVYGNGYTLSASGELGPLEPFVTPLPGALPEVLLFHLLKTNLFAVHAALMRARLFDVSAFDESLPALEDWDLWLRLALNGARFGYHHDRIAIYRRHAANMDVTTPAAFVNAKVAICSKIVTADLDLHLSPELRQRFRLTHLDAILWSRSPAVIFRALRTVLVPEEQLSLRGVIGLGSRVLKLPRRAMSVAGKFYRASRSTRTPPLPAWERGKVVRGTLGHNVSAGRPREATCSPPRELEPAP